MTTLFPHTILSFADLIAAIGPDLEPIVHECADKQLARRHRNLKRAEVLYRCAATGVRTHAFMHQFVQCFGESQQSMLFHPLHTEWADGRWADPGMGALLRALIKAGSSTSILLDTLGVDQLVTALRALPKHCLHTGEDLSALRKLPARVELHRGGWAACPAEMVARSPSWTTAHETAEDFIGLNIASSRPGQRPYHLHTVVDKADILLFCRDEDEAIVDPARVPGWDELQSRAVIRRKEFAVS